MAYDDTVRNFIRNTVGILGVSAILYIKSDQLISDVADNSVTAIEAYNCLYENSQQQNNDLSRALYGSSFKQQ
ncbi:hypothetical protein [Streptococcus mutans]|uniref:hypothetical protein n=1 Tax=Streptococcus mutans TaxID=1309 RepID=UPI0002B57278|nr:hypothetical protein [Streptococcus mutans]EMB62654.1 hypothetical protein SMU21_03815 [Streptococcus mutans 1SM1]EMC00453.1 hypothetical protein SMU68_09134 [Streptococcus mutans NFSM1]MCB4959900.1 hypothetical protein [Streptococcus mutans]MCB5127356.1 hypothetical protein [Streptococcus mutans]MCB5140230.1 hypothetical protein [Streptococcus mutans]